MNEMAQLALPTVAGVLLGALFFGGLWFTVRKGLRSDRPALWFMGSLMARMAVALGGFYLVSGGRWDRLAACLVGFLCARFVLTRMIEHSGASREDSLAP
ncbi:ATP synthase subunit I [Methylocystis heyeri]|uniref:ATP synthase subunit I n=1 Tax=Methylocystis heyeri TaxID=391905 RepID=A0A6B8KCV9_9HYPH|nr:ATP synthase subunit I [Methylocystis heyeri]QGM45517.1 ATP synthase subunit I [Methylocystis heyeri]